MFKVGDLLVPAFVVATFVFGIVAVYKVGENTGASDVQSQWDKQTKLTDAAINKMKGEYTVLQDQHTKAQEKFTNELALANAQHEDELSRYRSDYTGRLQLAEQRAGVYQRQAQGSAGERDDLARHATELDRTLEEGRALVRELGATLRQREVTIRALGGIILNDRTLLESK